MSQDELREHLDHRFDRIEDKIDDHLARISKAEEAIIWMKGHLKIATGFMLSIATAILTAYFKYLQ